VCPEVVMGLYTKEELEGVAPDNTPQPQAPAVAPAPIAIENPPAPAEAKNTAPLPVAGSAPAGPVDSTPLPKDIENWRYAGILKHCPNKDHSYEPWRISKYGKKFHIMPNNSFCNFRDAVKPYKDAIMKQHSLTDETLNEKLKAQFEGKTWSQLSETEQVIVLFVLDKVGAAQNPAAAPADALAPAVQSVMDEPPLEI